MPSEYALRSPALPVAPGGPSAVNPGVFFFLGVTWVMHGIRHTMPVAVRCHMSHHAMSHASHHATRHIMARVVTSCHVSHRATRHTMPRATFTRRCCVPRPDATARESHLRASRGDSWCDSDMQTAAAAAAACRPWGHRAPLHHLSLTDRATVSPGWWLAGGHTRLAAHTHAWRTHTPAWRLPPGVKLLTQGWC